MKNNQWELLSIIFKNNDAEEILYAMTDYAEGTTTSLNIAITPVEKNLIAHALRDDFERAFEMLVENLEYEVNLEYIYRKTIKKDRYDLMKWIREVA